MDANRAQTPLGGTRIGDRAALRLGVDRQAELLHVGNGKIGDRLRETLRALELVGALDAALQQRRRLRILHIAKDPAQRLEHVSQQEDHDAENDEPDHEPEHREDPHERADAQDDHSRQPGEVEYLFASAARLDSRSRERL